MGAAQAQHLWWKYEKKPGGYTCIYGEVEVLETGPTIYYCGCNWWPGSPAGGYTGIQDPGGGRHNMIFSIWDTSKDLHPRTIKQDDLAKANRFGGEGEGAHTHLDYFWQVGKTYRYYAVKKQDATGANTLCTAYFYDDAARKWVNEATISSPNDGGESVKTFGGGMNSFLENWSGRDKDAPKLALYRLWVGTSPKDLASVTSGQGDGTWGVLNDSFFLAGGEAGAIDAVLARHQDKGSELLRGAKGKGPLSVKGRTLSTMVVSQLEHLDD
jgi:hypothetical protein